MNVVAGIFLVMMMTITMTDKRPLESRGPFEQKLISEEDLNMHTGHHHHHH